MQVVVPSAQSAIDASLAARSAGQGALADALRDLGLAITDLFGAPGDAVLRARVLADIERLIERLVDPAFATLVTQLQNIRASIAGGTPQSLPGDLATLDGVLNEVANTTVSAGRHRFAARLEPNGQVASPQVPVELPAVGPEPRDGDDDVSAERRRPAGQRDQPAQRVFGDARAG